MMTSDRAPKTVAQNSTTHTLSSTSQAEFFMVSIRAKGLFNHNAATSYKFRAQWNP